MKSKNELKIIKKYIKKVDDYFFEYATACLDQEWQNYKDNNIIVDMILRWFYSALLDALLDCAANENGLAKNDKKTKTR